MIASAGAQPWWALPQSIFSGAFAGVISGVVFIGIGSRIVMRLIAFLNPQAKGVVTDAGNIVGEITVDGTIGLVVFIGLFGGFAIGGMWVIIREWLPAVLWPRVGIAAVITALSGSFNVIESDNVDFFVLEMATLNVVMFMALIGLAGASTALGDRWFQSRLPTGPGISVIYLTLLTFGVFLTLSILGNAFFVSGSFVTEPPRIEGAFLGITALATLGLWTTKILRLPSDDNLHGWLRFVGIIGVVGVVVFGTSYLVDQINPIVSQVFTTHFPD